MLRLSPITWVYEGLLLSWLLPTSIVAVPFRKTQWNVDAFNISIPSEVDWSMNARVDSIANAQSIVSQRIACARGKKRLRGCGAQSFLRGHVPKNIASSKSKTWWRGYGAKSLVKGESLSSMAERPSLFALGVFAGLVLERFVEKLFGQHRRAHAVERRIPSLQLTPKQCVSLLSEECHTLAAMTGEQRVRVAKRPLRSAPGAYSAPEDWSSTGMMAIACAAVTCCLQWRRGSRRRQCVKKPRLLQPTKPDPHAHIRASLSRILQTATPARASGKGAFALVQKPLPEGVDVVSASGKASGKGPPPASPGKASGKGPQPKASGKGKPPPPKSKGPPPPRPQWQKGSKDGKILRRHSIDIGELPFGQRMHWVAPLYETPGADTVFAELNGGQIDPQIMTRVFGPGMYIPRRTGAPKPKVGIGVLDTARAQNLAITVSRLRTTSVDLTKAVNELNFESAVGLDDLEIVSNILPTKDEANKLMPYLDTPEKLRDIEKKVLPLCTLSASRLRLMKIARSHRANYASGSQRCILVQAAAKEIRSSAEFRLLLATVLKIGNYINHGATDLGEGTVRGFAIESLHVLASFKKGGVSALHYLCLNTMQSCRSAFLQSLLASLTSVPQVARERMAGLRAEVDFFVTEARFVDSFMATLPEDAPEKHQVQALLNEIRGACEDMQAQHSQAIKLATDAQTYFSISEKAKSELIPFEEFCSHISNFLQQFRVAWQDIESGKGRWKQLAPEVGIQVREQRLSKLKVDVESGATSSSSASGKVAMPNLVAVGAAVRFHLYMKAAVAQNAPDAPPVSALVKEKQPAAAALTGGAPPARGLSPRLGNRQKRALSTNSRARSIDKGTCLKFQIDDADSGDSDAETKQLDDVWSRDWTQVQHGKGNALRPRKAQTQIFSMSSPRLADEDSCRPVVGDKVHIIGEQGDGDMLGTVLIDDKSELPFKVRLESGKQDWYKDTCVKRMSQDAPSSDFTLELHEQTDEKKQTKRHTRIKQLQLKYEQDQQAAQVPKQGLISKNKVKQLQSVFERVPPSCKMESGTNTDGSVSDSAPDEILLESSPTASTADGCTDNPASLADCTPSSEISMKEEHRWRTQPSVATWLLPLPFSDRRACESEPKLAVPAKVKSAFEGGDRARESRQMLVAPAKVKPACCRYARQFGA